MTKLLDQAIAKARELSPEEQDAVADALTDYIDAARDLQLTDEQVAEVERRKGEADEAFVPLDEAREMLARRYR